MLKIFSPEASNTHQSLLLRNFEAWPRLANRLNRQSMLSGWEALAFEFQQFDSRAITRPEICTTYISGAIAFRADLRSSVFPSPCDELEFLPIRAGSEDWLLLNCLRNTLGYDHELSSVSRNDNGEIFLVQKLVIVDRSVSDCGLFTLTDSNRAQIFVLDAWREGIRHSKIGGLGFREVGYLK
jgi:hypothetical protein